MKKAKPVSQIKTSDSIASEKREVPKQLLSQARELINSVSWLHARPPATEEYVVRMRSKEERKIFDFVSQLIKDFGYSGYFFRKKYRYVDVDDHKYWVIWPILNRELLSLGSDYVGYKISSKDDLVRALSSIASELPEKYIEMLRVHYRAPKRRITSTEIAEAVGYRNFGAVNLQYGKLARKIMENLNVPFIEDEEIIGYLVEFPNWPPHENEAIIWEMKPELAAALEELKWT